MWKKISKGKWLLHATFPTLYFAYFLSPLLLDYREYFPNSLVFRVDSQRRLMSSECQQQKLAFPDASKDLGRGNLFVSHRTSNVGEKETKYLQLWLITRRLHSTIPWIRAIQVLVPSEILFWFTAVVRLFIFWKSQACMW